LTLQPLLAFVHIARAGARAFSSAISADNYLHAEAYHRDPEATRRRLERIGSEGGGNGVDGHVPYGLFCHYLPADTRYVTVLREPVDVVLSHYYFHALAGKPPGATGQLRLRLAWEELLNAERLEREGGENEEPIVLEPDAEFSLEEGLRRKIPYYDNIMTRFLWGGESLFGQLPPDAVERAKENVSRFWFVGIRERLDDSIVLLGRKLGVGLMPYDGRVATQKRPPPDDIPTELRELVAERNEMDIELYRFAREQFEASAPPPDALAEDTEELRRLSAAKAADLAADKAAKAAEKARKAGKKAAQDEPGDQRSS
jgi:hypothetical protein